MAKIVLGVATPHAPQLRLPLEAWVALQKKDETDKRINWEELRKKVKPDIQEEIADGRMRERYAACQVHLRSLGEYLQRSKPDVIVVIGDDQHEHFHSDNMPMFCIYHGTSVEMARRYDSAGHKQSGSQSWDAPRLEQLQIAADEALEGPRRRPTDKALGEHLIAALRDGEFDVAVSDKLHADVGLGHAFRFLYQYLLPGTEIPTVPIMINTFFPPNQPTPKRCYALGHALRKAIESWPSNKRVAVVASGGLSHTIIDEDLDRRVMKAICDNDGATLASLPRERLKLGTSEILNWIAMGGCMSEMEAHPVGEYIPAYRSAAGTGCGMGFVYWTPRS
jgi:hypothetical protein